jgi:hypothetical protein
MIKPEQIPDEVVKAAFDAYLKDPCIDKAFFGKAIAAGLAAWPGMEYWPEFSDAGLGEHEPGKVFLPLTQEARDE